MILVSKPRSGTPSSLHGHLRSIAKPISRALDLPLGHREADPGPVAAARSGAYPPTTLSMSGSPPPPPPNTAHDVSNRGEVPGRFGVPRPHDAFRSSPVQPPMTHLRDASSTTYHLSRSYPSEPQAIPYAYLGHDEPNRPTSYGLQPPRPHHPLSHPGLPQPFLPAAGAGPAQTYPAPGRPPAIENQVLTSPKSQRRTKNHVASACVPCKRAHLRCDAQRPCSRCLGNGKEDACIDVQHKKRGRPRLRDERDSRFDPTRYDPLRRPPMYSSAPGGSGPLVYDDAHRRPQPFQSPDIVPMAIPLPPYHERGPAFDPNYYSPVSPAPLRWSEPEPLAYLDMNFEVIKVSPTFLSGIRSSDIVGRNLIGLVAQPQRQHLCGLQQRLVYEKHLREPNYLPPIMGRVDHVIHGLGFDADAARLPFPHREYLSFVESDDRQKTYEVGFRLGKQGSHFFVVMLLIIIQPLRSSSRYSTGRPISLYHQPDPAHPALGGQQQQQHLEQQYQQQQQHHSPNLASFDTQRDRHSDGSVRMALGPTSPSCGIDPPAPPPQAATMSRSDHPGDPTDQTFRGDLPPTSRQASHSSVQLPPIRARSDQRPPPPDPGPLRYERSSRLDIGGLIERPAGSRR